MLPVLFRLAVPLLSLATVLGAADANAALGSSAFQPSAERPVGWRGDGSGHFPGATPPTMWERKLNGNAYTTKGILWMTHMPAESIASPIVVGDRIFVCANMAELICVDKKTGQILWQRTNGYFEASRDSDRENPAYKSTAAPLAEQLQQLNDKLVQAANAGVSTIGLTADQELVASKQASQKRELEVTLYDAMRGIDPSRYVGRPYEQHCGTSSGTPTSDGQFVYASFLGGIHPCSMTVVCYDLTGKRQWLSMVEKFDASEHGNHSSMLLVGDRLIFFANALVIAYDKKTGKELWRNTGKNTDYTDGVSVPRLFKFNGEDAIFRPYTNANILSLADGTEVAKVTNLYFIRSTPLIEDGIAYWGDRLNNRMMIAFKLPTKSGEAAKQLFTYAAPKGKEQQVVASPLFHDGLVYIVSEQGWLFVVDAKTGAEVYTAQPFTPNVKWVFAPGVCESPALAGGNIYLMSDNGTAMVLPPGRTYKPLATNVLEEKPLGGFTFLNNFYFEGSRLYYRSGNYLYCIGDK